ncbi:putative oxidoreductase, Very-long-chain 3-oxoacyl-CoA synthase [Medicago truncatula]|uniref:Chalcone and stilbene synthases, N-terminal, putative n=1 Tax=Medicago truncatula TaxID=3880 RepID=Q2HTD1_MEDTR|nr:Chalcone and stilbene synthases, N-terminal, putative [Medicago truncatula]RHN49599.1 putative oxidoreductase, Very-long-chain 3-oxoacyl-CoA synthase [Medicago truncatula]
MDFLHLVKKLNNVKLLSFVLILFLKAKQNTNIIIGLVVPVLLLGVYLAKRSSSSVVYLVEFACYKPGKERKTINETIMKKMEECGLYNENTIEFQHRILRKSGFGDEYILTSSSIVV